MSALVEAEVVNLTTSFTFQTFFITS